REFSPPCHYPCTWPPLWKHASPPGDCAHALSWQVEESQATGSNTPAIASFTPWGLYPAAH
ncbi:MAG: hypothetical protein OJI67_24585, partial [Prosthecobacter sp.]|nr:hypothetical protein [Prosthecobacter sp.]